MRKGFLKVTFPAAAASIGLPVLYKEGPTHTLSDASKVDGGLGFCTPY